MKRDDSKYCADPTDVAERVCRLLALHDNINDIDNISLTSTFKDLGFNELDMVEIMLGAEWEFDIEISNDDHERMHTVNDLVEAIATNWYT